MKKFLSFIAVSFFLLGLFAFAKDNSEVKDNNGTGNRQEISDHTGKENKKVFTGLSADAIACVTTAVVTRDTTIKWWMDVYHTTWTATFNARTAAFTVALSLATTKEIKNAMNSAWKINEKAMKTAQKVKRNVIQTAWSDYRVDLKTCKTDIAKGLMQERGGNDFND